jgi:uncharacterized protein involved in exopolysaccharide biosynthesis
MKIFVKNFRADMVVSGASTAQTSPPSEVSEARINTEIELLGSNDLLRQVAIASKLARLESAKGSAPGDQQQFQLEMAVARLHRDLKISPVRKADIIELNYVANDPHQVITVLTQLASSYLEAHVRIHGSPGTYEFFSKQAEHYVEELRNAEAAFTDFRLKKDIVLFGQQKEEILRRAAEASSTLLATEASIREYTLTIADARAQAAGAAPRVVTQSRAVSNQTSVERLSTMMVELQNRRTQLLAKYRPDDRLVEEVSQELRDTEAALEKSKTLTGSDQATDINPVRQSLELEVARQQAQLAGLQARREELTRQAENYRARLARLDSATATYEDLMRNRKEAEENYLLYARKTEEARIADALDQQKIANVSIAEHPVEPRLPSRPDIPLNLALGTVMAGLLSLGAAFAAEYLNQPFPQGSSNSAGDQRTLSAPARTTLPDATTRADLESITGLPVLAVTRHTPA